MSKKGISDAQAAKEKLWTDSDFSSGKIKAIRFMDNDFRCCGPDDKSDETIPIYGQIEVNFDDHVYATIPCTVAEAKEYEIGQKVSISLNTDDSDD